ncbi:MAG TPA: DUF2269 family protein [Solirubrobacterales bacterium]
MPVAISGYEIGLFLHVVAAFLAFGPTFGYAFFQAVTERTNPRGVPTMWRATEMASNYLVTPAAIVLLLAGLYLTIDAWEFSDVFIGVGILAVLVLLGLVHGFLNPQGRRAIALADRDIAAAGTGEVEFSDEYWAVSKRIAQIGSLAGVIIVVAIFFMTVKP